ncbi:P-loop containing nucleoside triphosphate hydrolase protein [Dipodascopsis tothii]|uniref:P-loop containing nucleoside triphosphate hydrolase protein n=1 Tax=Dipodascopsis tothii TaxID=44089 RepID=UPI0034CF46A2
MARGLPQKAKLRGVDKVVAVSSAKGGVGKSTLSVNLAIAMAMQGKRVGILDADIFGPSVPKLLDLAGEPELTDRNLLRPLSNYGVKAMSMGFLLPDEGAPVVWRGLMVMKALQQLLHEVEWGGLDVLVLDMPPGTGDVQLTITQQVVVDGAVIVSTPQDVALLDAVKGTNMFRKVGVPILGMVENMSMYVCSNCGHEEHVFGRDNVQREAGRLGLDVLGSVPLHAAISRLSDSGQPAVLADRAAGFAQVYRDIAAAVLARL